MTTKYVLVQYQKCSCFSIAALLLCFGVFNLVRRGLEQGVPSDLILLGGLGIWVAVSVGFQVKAWKHRHWEAFMRTMPVSPFERIVVNMSLTLLPMLGMLCAMLAILFGCSVEMFLWTAPARWGLLGLSFLWIFSLGSVVSVALSGTSRFRFVAFAVGLVWSLQCVARIALLSPSTEGLTVVLSELLRILRSSSLGLFLYVLVLFGLVVFTQFSAGNEEYGLFILLIGDLSYGNRRKVLIAAALIASPKLLLLDEPSNGLDVNSLHALNSICGCISAQGRGGCHCFASLDFSDPYLQ